MLRYKKEVLDLMRKSGAFRGIHEVDGFVYVFNEVNDLTGFCAPMLSKKGGLLTIAFEYGMAVPMEDADTDLGLIQSISQRSVILPRIVGPDHVFDTLINDDGISPWITNEMADMMCRFTLPRDHALRFVQGSDDRHLSALKRVYREKFVDWITQPLTNLAPQT